MADNDDPVLGDMIEEDEINQINREVIVMVQGGDDGGDDMWYKGRLTNDKTELVVSHIWENGDWQQSDGQIPFGHIAAFYDLPAGLPAQVGGRRKSRRAYRKKTMRHRRKSKRNHKKSRRHRHH